MANKLKMKDIEKAPNELVQEIIDNSLSTNNKYSWALIFAGLQRGYELGIGERITITIDDFRSMFELKGKESEKHNIVQNVTSALRGLRMFEKKEGNSTTWISIFSMLKMNLDDEEIIIWFNPIIRDALVRLENDNSNWFKTNRKQISSLINGDFKFTTNKSYNFYMFLKSKIYEEWFEYEITKEELGTLLAIDIFNKEYKPNKIENRYLNKIKVDLENNNLGIFDFERVIKRRKTVGWKLTFKDLANDNSFEKKSHQKKKQNTNKNLTLNKLKRDKEFTEEKEAISVKDLLS